MRNYKHVSGEDIYLECGVEARPQVTDVFFKHKVN
jgi:hypothetical protein